MKKAVLLSIFCWITTNIYAQWGINFGAQYFKADAWEAALLERSGTRLIHTEVFKPSVYMGLDYKFRLDNKRIELLPELAFSRFEIGNRQQDGIMVLEENYQMQFFSFHLNTNIYFLDFNGVYKESSGTSDEHLLKKGLFFRFAPEIKWVDQTNSYAKLNGGNSNRTFFSADRSGFSLRTGIGLDIDISDFLTVTPLIQANYNFPITWKWPGADIIESPRPVFNREIAETPIQFFAGLRMGIHFYQINKLTRQQIF